VITGHPDQRRIAPLLDLDPDLGRHLSPDGVAAARCEIAVRVVARHAGPWRLEKVASTDPRHLGLLVIDGLLAREVLADDVTSMELAGPGDVLRPWEESTDVPLLRATVRWTILADARLAILDREVAGRLARHPEIYSALMARLVSRARGLAVMQAICQLNRVDRRVLTVLWHLAERWGRVTPAGVVVPLALSHRLLAELVGARRPTVTTALGELFRAGEVSRTANGAWLLTGEPPGQPDEHHSRLVAHRRTGLASAVEAVAELEARTANG
jgi:CRP/FNR family cyclic AMP-dependent transcriptional regulator